MSNNNYILLIFSRRIKKKRKKKAEENKHSKNSYRQPKAQRPQVEADKKEIRISALALDIVDISRSLTDKQKQLKKDAVSFEVCIVE